jgi:hypothetical protein
MPRWPNRRLIDALATAPLKGAATQELDELCRGRNQDGTRVARFNPVDAQTVLLFIAVLQAKLFDTAPRDDREARRRTHRTSRLIAKLRGHRLIAKVGKSRLLYVAGCPAGDHIRRTARKAVSPRRPFGEQPVR